MKQITPFKIIRKNLPHHLSRDTYHSLLAASWTRTILLTISFFLVINSIFATAYWLMPGSLNNSDNSWLDAFFFSVQTLGTIGYGQLSPATTMANVLVTIQAAMGLIIVAIMAGLFFAKFSRPIGKVEFTDNMVIHTYDGQKTLIFRMLNIRDNQVMDSRVQLSLLKEHNSLEGHSMRRFHELKLVRSHVPLFAMSMNLMHIIDETSPLKNFDFDSSTGSSAEILVSMIGTDGTMGQTIHASKSYRVKDIIWNKKFKDMVTILPDRTRIVDYGNFNEVVSLT